MKQSILAIHTLLILLERNDLHFNTSIELPYQNIISPTHDPQNRSESQVHIFVHKVIRWKQQKITMEIKMTSDACREKITLENYIALFFIYITINQI